MSSRASSERRSSRMTDQPRSANAARQQVSARSGATESSRTPTSCDTLPSLRTGRRSDPSVQADRFAVRPKQSPQLRSDGTLRETVLLPCKRKRCGEPGLPGALVLPIRRGDGKLKLILDKTELDSYIKTNGRWLYHATAEESLAGIEESGIKPGSDVGRSNEHDGVWRPRSGRIYLSTLAVCHRRQRDGDLPLGTARIDLTQLDPDRIGADEDLVQRAWHAGEPWLDAPPPLKQVASADGTLAEWAETTPGFDGSEVTSKSLWGGGISYTDAVPAAAVQAVDRRGYRRG